MQKSLPETHTFDQLVVIGASAGGIDALSTLVATLSRDFPAPIVIAQHLDPAHASHLGEILARRGSLPVRTVTNHEALQPGVVFVVPANRHVEITDHAVGLRADDQGRSKPSVDLLLSSAAAIFGERVIAVILTGSGSDGTAGARAVKAAGGTVVIQDPATAAYPSMPRSLAPTTVDIVADLERIGPLLGDLLTGATPAAGGADRESAATEEEALAAVLAQVRARQGLDFTQYKAPTILRRLQRRVAATGVGALTAYGAYLDGHPAEYRRLVSSFLINVTEFFRDAALFDELRDHALPELIAHARAHGNELRLWSAGCATGEEAYSLAILVAEALGDELERFTVRLFATDLDADAIAFARRGVYAASALATMPDDLRARYFTPVDGAYEVTKRVRGLVVFGEHDLGQRPPFPRVDLALCRNVLIYFTPDLQTRALQLFAFALRTGGYLALGTAETPHALAAYFTAAHPRLKIYRRTGAPAPVPPTWRRGGTGSPPLRALAGGAPAHGAGPVTSNPAADGAALDLVMDERTMPAAPADLLAEIPWGVVVVDRRYDIQSINRAARHLLGIYRKAVGEDLIHLAPNAPAAPLRAAIDTAFRDAAPTRVEEIMPVNPGHGRGEIAPAGVPAVRDRSHRRGGGGYGPGERHHGDGAGDRAPPRGDGPPDGAGAAVGRGQSGPARGQRRPDRGHRAGRYGGGAGPHRGGHHAQRGVAGHQRGDGNAQRGVAGDRRGGANDQRRVGGAPRGSAGPGHGAGGGADATRGHPGRHRRRRARRGSDRRDRAHEPSVCAPGRRPRRVPPPGGRARPAAAGWRDAPGAGRTRRGVPSGVHGTSRGWNAAVVRG